MTDSLHPTQVHVEQHWKFVAASVRGTSHTRSELPCQDAVRVEELNTPAGPVLITVVSDGAGSAVHAELGSHTACDALVAEVRDYLRSGERVDTITRDTVDRWCVAVLRLLTTLAEERDAQVRDFACTLLCAVTAVNTAVFFQIGDGAIVVSSGDTYAAVFWPQNGEYANTTYFITDPEALMRVQFAVSDAPDEIALFSDGIQNLALRNLERTAHAPFFLKMFPPVRAGAPGMNASLASALVALLDSALINDKTDDDKTLILASRTPEAPKSADGSQLADAQLSSNQTLRNVQDQ